MLPNAETRASDMGSARLWRRGPVTNPIGRSLFGTSEDPGGARQKCATVLVARSPSIAARASYVCAPRPEFVAVSRTPAALGCRARGEFNMRTDGV